MSNPAVITLANLCDGVPNFPYRFEIEDNIGEAIHIHYKDIRLDLTVREFLDLADTARELICSLMPLPDFDLDYFDPVQLVGIIGDFPRVSGLVDDEIYLNEIVVDTVDADGLPCYDFLENSRVVRALKGNSTQNDEHHQINFFKPHSFIRYSNAERIQFNLESVKTLGYPNGKERILLQEHSNIILDGQHRAAILYFLRGDIKVPIRRICYKTDKSVPEPQLRGVMASLYYRGPSENYREERRLFTTDMELSGGHDFRLESGVTNLRFDPVEGQNCVVTDLVISCNGNQVSPKATNGLKYANSYYFFTDDPQIEIALPEEAEQLWIRAKVVPLSLGGVRELIEQLENKISSFDAQREEFEKEKRITISKLNDQLETMQEQLTDLHIYLTELETEKSAQGKVLSETQEHLEQQSIQLEATSKQLEVISVQLKEKSALLKEYKEREQKLQEQMHNLSVHFENMQKSLSFRIGRLLTWLPRRLRSFGTKIFGSSYVGSFKTNIHKTIMSMRQYGFRQTVRKVIQKLSNHDPHRGMDLHVDSNSDYHNWIARYNTVRDSDIEEMKGRLLGFKYLPLISVVIPVYNTNHEFLCQLLDSVLNQTYPYFEVCIAEDASPDKEIKVILQEYSQKDERIKVVFRESNGGICAASNSALAISSGEYVALVDHDDFLPVEALFTICHYINLYDNEVDLLYSDEDKLDAQGNRFDPYFKGGWNRRLIYQQNFVAHLGVYRRTIIDEIGGFRQGFEGSQDYDLLLRFLKKTTDERIAHIPYILYSWRKYSEYGSFSTQNQDKSDLAAKRALEEYFEGQKLVLPREGLCGCWCIKNLKPASDPLVSIIIPTKDKVYILKNCIQGLLEKTDYSNIEIIIVDNASCEEKTLHYLEKLSSQKNIRVLRDDREFNYSRLNNEAAEQARGDYLLFLNNDIAIMRKDWLRNMVDISIEDKVGAVGAKLLYSNHNVQHAGVVTGIYEVAGHLYRHTHDSNGGYFGLLFLERNVSAVTGACMLVPKHVFHEVGGFDERNLAVSFNDVDLSLKIRDAGYDVVYTPDAKLYHLESLSRGMDITREQQRQNYLERRFMHQKYGKVLLEDPFYSPVLSLSNEDGNFADRPRIGKPWRDWIEFVCPFHRGDTLIGLQVAYTAAKHGIKIRMHVSALLIKWLKDFDYGDSIVLEAIDIGIPMAEETAIFLREAMDKVALREDSSGNIVCSHPIRHLEDMGIDLTENMLRQFGLPIDTKLVNVSVKNCCAQRKKELEEMLGYPPKKTILLHPYGGWTLKSMSPEIIKKIVRICHKVDCRVVQIGGEKDPEANEVDGKLLKNLPLREWAFLFKSVCAVIGVDSWTAHFASIVNANQAIVYGSTDHQDVGSKSHFANSAGECMVFSSQCDCVPCNSLLCQFGNEFCIGMDVDERLEAFLQNIKSQ